MSNEIYYPHPVMRMDKNHLNEILLHAVRHNASDVHLQTDEKILADVYGRMETVFERKMMQEEMQALTNAVFGEHGAPLIAQGKPIDASYEIKPSRGERYRFRVNAIGCQVHGHNGIQITFRTIPTTPPTPDQLGLNAQTLKGMIHHQGLVLITGATGSGKSTLLSAVLRHIAEQPEGHHKIITIEDPIEFVYDSVEKPTTLVSQSEIRTHVPTWADGIRAALRRKPTIILVGEARDPETISAAVTAAQTGHLVYSTVHTNGVPETIARMIGVFPKEERYQRQADIIDALRAIISQRLEKSTDGKRVALRETLFFDDSIRRELLSANPDRLSSITRNILYSKGRPMASDAKDFLDKGLIRQYDYDKIVASHGAPDKAPEFDA